MIGIDAILALAGLVVPPAVDFIKKKFIKQERDTPEATLSTLATTKPEVMADYVTATASYLDAQTRYFNRDVSGVPSVWVINLRASIRPVGVLLCFAILALSMLQGATLDDGVKYFCVTVASSWFGSQLVREGK